MTTTPAQLAPFAREVIEISCGVVSDLALERDRISSVSKDDRSPVTVADFSVQAIVGLHLKGCGVQEMIGEEDAEKLRENATLRSEVVMATQRVFPNATEDDVLESIDSGCHEGGPNGMFWTLDPIDGTKGFLRGGQFALALALIQDGDVELGLLGLPHWGITSDPSGSSVQPPGSVCMAIRGSGAHGWVLGESEEHRLHVADWSDGSTIRTCESVESGHTSHDASAQITEAFVAHEAVRLDSQAKYAVVASGAADAYLRLPTRPGYVERIWDHAAGALVATESGAIVSDIHGNPLDFSKGRGLEVNKGVVCSVPGAHQRIIDRIHEIGIG
jgi:3'(2'), 5'-bisphosphate nucleotidase